MHHSIVEALKIVKWPVFPRLLLLKLSSALICVSVFPAVRVQSQSGKDSSGLRRILCTHSKTRRSSEASTGQSDPSLRSDSVMMIHCSPPQTSASPRVCVSVSNTPAAPALRCSEVPNGLWLVKPQDCPHDCRCETDNMLTEYLDTLHTVNQRIWFSYCWSSVTRHLDTTPPSHLIHQIPNE